MEIWWIFKNQIKLHIAYGKVMVCNREYVFSGGFQHENIKCFDMAHDAIIEMLYLLDVLKY